MFLMTDVNSRCSDAHTLSLWQVQSPFRGSPGADCRSHGRRWVNPNTTGWTRRRCCISTASTPRASTSCTPLPPSRTSCGTSRVSALYLLFIYSLFILTQLGKIMVISRSFKNWMFVSVHTHSERLFQSFVIMDLSLLLFNIIII